MLLKQLKYFTEVITCQSFTEAAEKCCISQSAISQQIRALEENLGVELIQRKNRKFFLTPAGEYFYRHGLVLLEEAKRLKKETVRIGEHKQKSLRIGYLKCLGGAEFRQAVSVFSAKHPALELEFAAADHDVLFDMLCFGEEDVIVSDKKNGVFEKYNNILLAAGRHFIEISERSTLSALTSVTPEDLKMIPCIIDAPKNQMEKKKDYYVNTLGFHENFLFTETLEEARIMAAADKGFLLSEKIWADSGQGETALCRIPLCRSGKQIKTDYCVFWKKEQPDSCSREFAEILHGEFQKYREQSGQAHTLALQPLSL